MGYVIYGLVAFVVAYWLLKTLTTEHVVDGAAEAGVHVTEDQAVWVGAFFCLLLGLAWPISIPYFLYRVFKK